MICNKCGSQISDGSEICPNCGNRFNNSGFSNNANFNNNYNNNYNNSYNNSYQQNPQSVNSLSLQGMIAALSSLSIIMIIISVLVPVVGFCIGVNQMKKGFINEGGAYALIAVASFFFFSFWAFIF